MHLQRVCSKVISKQNIVLMFTLIIMGLINLIGYIQIRAVNKGKQDWLYIIKCGSYLE